MNDEPIMDVAHLGHIELLTPTPEASLRFFVDVLGMTESGRRGESVYLRGWDDYERASLKLTGSHTSGLGHAAFRARSPQALQRRVAALERSGAGVGWHEGELGHGPAYQFHDPDGHLIEIYYETERYQPPPEERHDRLARFPYLAPDFSLLPRTPDSPAWISDIHLFSIASTMSFGPSGSSINAMTTAIPKLVSGLTRGLFKGDLEQHWASFLAYDTPQAIVRHTE